MARREIKPWHYNVTAALAFVTLFFVIAYFGQNFKTFFMTDQDPVLIAVERVKEKILQKKADNAAISKDAVQSNTEPGGSLSTEPKQADKIGK